ncbi:hypothetical protein CAPTEDRAFT_186877 [Capitella teleta]|uniref:Uncharacterized protein n=1 Tax=Capitella teleta TaxID=283909 RepID=R7UYW3_CAPTE|nr:hypothetical protein CAPTEDRAFT_186877 [Capitella teleta]|eukprot:ELU08586.1 hypothetical protein CAPTEDRAFT_186877 [Capitella teleta]
MRFIIENFSWHSIFSGNVMFFAVGYGGKFFADLIIVLLSRIDALINNFFACNIKEHSMRCTNRVCNDVDVEIQLLCRNVRFLRSLERSNNRVVRCCFQLVQNGSRSTVSRSFSKLCDVTQKSRHHIVESVCHPTALFKIGNDHEEMAGLVRDLLALRAGLELDQNLSAHDIELLRDINFSIRELCTH